MGNHVQEIKSIVRQVLPAPVYRAVRNGALRRITNQIERAEILPYQPDIYPQGINLIGPIDSATGLGQSIRLLEQGGFKDLERRVEAGLRRSREFSYEREAGKVIHI